MLTATARVTTGESSADTRRACSHAVTDSVLTFCSCCSWRSSRENAWITSIQIADRTGHAEHQVGRHVEAAQVRADRLLVDAADDLRRAGDLEAEPVLPEGQPLGEVVGVDVAPPAVDLVEEGVAAFAKAFTDLIDTIGSKSASLATAGASADG